MKFIANHLIYHWHSTQIVIIISIIALINQEHLIIIHGQMSSLEGKNYFLYNNFKTFIIVINIAYV